MASEDLNQSKDQSENTIEDQDPQSELEKFLAEKDNTYTLKLTQKQVIYVVLFFALAGVSIITAIGYGAYRTSQINSLSSELKSLRQSTYNQQDQILQLSKKASALQGEIDQLTQIEQALRRAFSIQPAEEDEDDVKPGQGGPISSVTDLKNVFDALKSAEKRLATRADSVTKLQGIIKMQRELFENNGELGVFKTPEYSALPDLYTSSYLFSQMTKVPQGWPASGVVTSPYGLRWGGTDFHPGIDIANDLGTPILATADGTVEFAGWNAGGYGNMVDINHGNGMMTRYAHGSAVVVSAGQTVRKGQLIMYMGSTGFSTGPHVHYEVWVDGQRINPVSYL